MLSCTFNFHELKATLPALLLDGYLAYYISQKTLDSEYRCGLLYTQRRYFVSVVMDFEMEKNNVVWTSLETESKPGTIEFDVHEPQGLKGEVKRNWFLKKYNF